MRATSDVSGSRRAGRARSRGARRASGLTVLLGVSLACVCSCSRSPRREVVAHGRFEKLELSVPREPESVVLVLSDAADAALADRLSEQASRQGALVTRIDAPAFAKVLDATPEPCVFPSGDLDNLAHFVQAYLRLPRYEPAILIGVGSGASLARGALLQAPHGTFAGAIVIDACGQSALASPLCAGEDRAQRAPDPPRTLSSFDAVPAPAEPLIALRAGPERRCATEPPPAAAAAQDLAAFEGAYARLAALAQARALSAPTDLAELPIVEVPASGPERPDAFAILLSGDGGWAGIDKEVSAKLAARGLGVVGLDSLRYFWNERSPEGTAADLERIIQRYQAAWKRRRVVLLGYSQGADVLPFIVNRLSASSRASLASVVALSLSKTATFEFHLRSWVGASGDRPTLPEVLRLARGPLVCVYGTQDADALCPELDPDAFRVIAVPGDHHFNGDYERVASIVLDTLKPRH